MSRRSRSATPSRRRARDSQEEALLDAPAAVTPPHVLLQSDDSHPRSEPDDCCVCLEPLRPDGHHAARPVPLPVCPRHVLHLGCLAQLRVQARRPSVAGGWAPEHDDQLTAWCREAGLHPPSRLPDRRTDQASVADYAIRTFTGQDAPEPQAPAHVKAILISSNLRTTPRIGRQSLGGMSAA